MSVVSLRRAFHASSWRHNTSPTRYSLNQIQHLLSSFNIKLLKLKKHSRTVGRVRESKKVALVPKSHYKRSTHPTSAPIAKLLPSNFPLSVADSVRDYQQRLDPLKFQDDLLRLLPFYGQTDALGRTSEVIRTKLPGSDNYINEFVIYPPNYKSTSYQECKHLIMVHGYGGGIGFFLKNFDRISTLDNWVVHSIDLLGYGCLSRPPFKLEKEDLAHVEAWFHDSFDHWLRLRGLKDHPENVMVMAHSMGAYLMATYGIKHSSSFCKRLMMVSPGAILKHRTKIHVPAYFARLWEQNISPFTLIRQAGPLGSKLVSMWSSRRFANLPKNEAELLHRYAYGIFNSPGSGEYMLNYLLAPGADARFPLVERGVHKLKCTLLWCYGKEDWMDKKGGVLCSNIINNYYKDAKRSLVVEIENSGHHIYLDNIEKFNELLISEMKLFTK